MKGGVRPSDAANCLHYAEAIHRHKPSFLPALKELLRLEVCSRCCLRYAGVRADVYAKSAPVTSSLCRALQDLLKPGGRPPAPAFLDVLAAEPPAEASVHLPAEETDMALPQTLPNGVQSQNAASGSSTEQLGSYQSDAFVRGASIPQSPPKPSEPHSPREAAPEPASNAQAEAGWAGISAETEPVCRVCLGVLQSLDGPLQLIPDSLVPQLSERDGGGALWSPVLHGDISSIAQHIRRLDYACHGVAIELSLPASTQLRQLSMWYHLKSLPETASLFTGTTLRDDVVDLKESLRIRGTLAEPLAASLQKPLDPANGDLRVTLNYIHPSSASESDFLFGRAFNGRSQKRRRKRNVVDVDARVGSNVHWPGLGRSSSEAVVTAAGKWSPEKFRQECAVPPLPSAQSVHLMLASRRLPLYIGGMYRKLERDVSQSPWTIDGQKKGRTSVQEEIERFLLPGLRCDGCKFITAGREDMDVRMLGEGRPFIMEVQNQRAEMPGPDFFANVENDLAKSGVGVEVLRLQPVSKEKLQAIKEGEQSKQKSYEAICRLPSALTPEMAIQINSTTDLMLHQNTPQRVAHRRALLLRERMVYSMHCEPIESDVTLLKLTLRTQAGTYIKEFVHGDEGRTEPNLGSFLGFTEPAAILQLDVLKIHMDFLDS